jgi:hypothetical protein
MRDFKSKLAREVGKLHDWKGPLWHSRYTLIPISEEPEAQIARLRYLVAHGTKEDLVQSPLQWPGVHAVKHFVRGEPLRGVWIDRTAWSDAKAKPEDLDKYTRRCELELTPLPGYDKRGFARLIRRLLRQILKENRSRRRVEGKTVLGAEKVLAVHPHRLQPPPKWRPPPLVHAFRREVRREMVEALRLFLEAYREAAERLKDGVSKPGFPPGCFPPAGPFVPWPTG